MTLLKEAKKEAREHLEKLQKFMPDTKFLTEDECVKLMDVFEKVNLLIEKELPDDIWLQFNLMSKLTAYYMIKTVYREKWPEYAKGILNNALLMEENMRDDGDPIELLKAMQGKGN